MSNSKEKDIVLYELSDKLNYTICLKIPSEPPITVKKSKLDSAKSWESKKNNIEKNKSIECTFDDNLKYRLIFNVVTTPTILNVRNRNYQEYILLAYQLYFLGVSHRHQQATSYQILFVYMLYIYSF